MLREGARKAGGGGYFGSRSFQLIRLSSFAHPDPSTWLRAGVDLDSTPIFLMISYLISDTVQVSLMILLRILPQHAAQSRMVTFAVLNS
jgi:hypothetical protein